MALSGSKVQSNAGGIWNSGTITIANSTVSGNQTAGNPGGGIYASTTLTLVRCTLAFNSAQGPSANPDGPGGNGGAQGAAGGYGGGGGGWVRADWDGVGYVHRVLPPGGSAGFGGGGGVAMSTLIGSSFIPGAPVTGGNGGGASNVGRGVQLHRTQGGAVHNGLWVRPGEARRNQCSILKGANIALTKWADNSALIRRGRTATCSG